MPRIVVVGGGIAGLAAAHEIRCTAPDSEVVVLEREPRIGGKIQTDRVDGFVIEAGPDSFLTSKPGGLDLCRGLGLESVLQGTTSATRRSFVMRKGRLHEMPQGLSGLVPSRLGPLFRSDVFSPLGKARLALEYVVPKRRVEGDESVGAFMRRRFGREAYARLIEPLMTGIYGGDGDELGLKATFPQLGAMEQRHGSLLRGLRAARQENSANGARPAFVTPVSGMSAIVEALHGELGRAIHCNATVVELRTTKRGYEVCLSAGERIEADAIILATPAYTSAVVMEPLDPDLAQLLSGIPYASTVTISLGYDAKLTPVLNGHGYLVPRSEGRQVLACTWSSSKFAYRAPDGKTLIRVFVGRPGQGAILDLSDHDLVAVARREIESTLGITAQPILSRLYRWPRAMPRYTVGHQDRLHRIEKRVMRHGGLALAGSPYTGVGIPDCITSGKRAADSALRFLAGEPSA